MDKLIDRKLKEIEKRMREKFLKRRRELRENELSKDSKQKYDTKLLV